MGEVFAMKCLVNVCAILVLLGWIVVLVQEVYLELIALRAAAGRKRVGAVVCVHSAVAVSVIVRVEIPCVDASVGLGSRG